jgi:hypothetical protein
MQNPVPLCGSNLRQNRLAELNFAASLPPKHVKHLFAASRFGPTQKGMLIAFRAKPKML